MSLDAYERWLAVVADAEDRGEASRTMEYVLDAITEVVGRPEGVPYAVAVARDPRGPYELAVEYLQVWERLRSAA